MENVAVNQTTKQKSGQKTTREKPKMSKTVTKSKKQNQNGKAVEKQASPPAEVSPGSPGKKGRPPTKRKRIKKTHGPDFETYFVSTPTKIQKRRESHDKKEEKPVDQASTGSRKSPNTNSESESVCDFCLNGVESNRHGVMEQLLYCKDCQAKAHPSCMDYSEELAKRALTSPWQCIDCKVCYVCEDAGDSDRNDSMLFCDACDKGYHMDCHKPALSNKPTGKWVCSNCGEENTEMVEEKKSDSPKSDSVEIGHDGDSNSVVLPTPAESPVTVANYDTPSVYSYLPTFQSQINVNIAPLLKDLPSFKRYADQPVPDVSTWTIDEVVDFFTEAGFGEHAHVFREQEIDGKSLLLLKRADVVDSDLFVNMCVALKIFIHVQRFQTNGQLIL